MLCQDWKDSVKKQGCDTLIIEEWETPVSKYPAKKIGDAEIKKSRYNKGIYIMEGVRGSEFYCIDKRIPITTLKIRNKQVMVDDPLHQYGMEDLAKHSKGKVLVGGLGLGMVAHALAKNKDVESIDIVEKNKDVIKLVSPFIPEEAKVHQGDVFDDKWAQGDYDTVILDLWVKRGETLRIAGGEKTHVGEMLATLTDFKIANPDAKVMIWGMRHPDINPAVTKRDMCKAYKELARMM